MSEASDLVWDMLDGANRGEAAELFQDALFVALGDDADYSGNGGMVDAAEAALNYVCKDPKRLEALKEWIEEFEDEDE